MVPAMACAQLIKTIRLRRRKNLSRRGGFRGRIPLWLFEEIHRMQNPTATIHTESPAHTACPGTQQFIIRTMAGEAGAFARPIRFSQQGRAILIWLGWLALVLGFVATALRADETCSSPYLARI